MGRIVMAEEKGRVALFGKRWSGRAIVAEMLVSGELKDCSMEPADSNNECRTYVGRGWTVVDTMGFGEPMGGLVPEEYVRRMTVDFLNEVKGHYSHIIFVVDRADFGFNSAVMFPIPIMWRTFLEVFKGGEDNFVVLVTNETPDTSWEFESLPKLRPELKESFKRIRIEVQKAESRRIEKMFPECKHFLFTEFGIPDPEDFLNDGHAVLGIESLERFEKEMEGMFTAADCPWVEPEICKMGDVEIEEMAARISHLLTSSPAFESRQWSWQGSAYEESGGHPCGLSAENTTREELQERASGVLRVRDEMQKLGKEVKFFPRQCEHLLQRSMGASKELHGLVGGTVKTIDDDNDDFHLEPLLKSLDMLGVCTQAARELLRLCGNSAKQQEAALTLSSRPLPGTTDFHVSKFALVVRDLEWALDAFRFLLHNPEASRARSESERQSWLSRFSWCESRSRLVYVEVDEDEGIDSESSTVAADNGRQAEDQRDLVSAMESHFETFRNPS